LSPGESLENSKEDLTTQEEVEKRRKKLDEMRPKVKSSLMFDRSQKSMSSLTLPVPVKSSENKIQQKHQHSTKNMSVTIFQKIVKPN